MAWTNSGRSQSSGVSLLTTELNSLGNGSLSAAGSAVDNDADHDQLCDLELAVTFGSAATANAVVSVWFLGTVDGTNFEDGSSSVQPNRPPDAVFVCRAVTAHRVMFYGARVPPRDFKPLLLNSSGQAFPASGSTLKAFFYN
jgi:hypothetical protein